MPEPGGTDWGGDDSRDGRDVLDRVVRTSRTKSLDDFSRSGDGLFNDFMNAQARRIGAFASPVGEGITSAIEGLTGLEATGDRSAAGVVREQDLEQSGVGGDRNGLDGFRITNPSIPSSPLPIPVNRQTGLITNPVQPNPLLLDPLSPDGTGGALAAPVVPGSAAAPFEPADASVATQLAKVLASDSPFLTAARTRAAQESNRRGLLNSSLAVQAGEAAAYNAALPIASQQAAQVQQSNLQGSQIASSEKISQSGIAAQERIAASSTAAFDREKAMAAVAQLDNTYNATFSAISNNADIPTEAREAYLKHLAAIRDSNFNMIEQLYNVDLVWASPAV